MKNLRYFFSFVKKYKKNYIFGLIALMFTDIFMLFTPKITAFAIDSLKSIITKSPVHVSFYLDRFNNFLQPFVNSLLEKNPFSLLLFAGATIIIVNLLAGFFRFLWRLNISKSSFLVDYDIRNAYYKKILALPMEFFSEFSTGEIMARATNDLNAIRMLAGPGLLAFFDPLFVGLIAMINMLIINPKLTLIALVPLPFIAVLVYIFQRIIFKYFKHVQKSFSQITNFTQNTFSGIKIIKTYTQEDSMSENFEGFSDKYRKIYMKLIKTESLFHPMILFFSSISMVIVLYFGGLKAIDGTLSIGNFYAFARYLMTMIWPMIAIGWVISIWARGLASLSRIMDVMNWESEDTGIKKEKIETIEELEFKNVWFKYPKSENWVLKNVSFSVNRGEKIAFVGKIGSGKSSIVELILRLYDIQKGEILINGKSVDNYNLLQLRKLFGYVPQESFLFSESLKDNLVLSGNYNNDEVINVIKTSGLYETINEFSDGFNTMVGEKGVTLSGGQRQRMTIARAIYKKPDFLIFDDSFSSIDSNVEKKILNELESNYNNMTQLFIAHRFSTIQHVNNILVLKNGEIIETGSFNNLLKKQGEFFRIYESQRIDKK